MDKNREFSKKELNNIDQKVDYTFLYRHEVTRLLDSLITNEFDVEELKSVVQHVNKMESAFYQVASQRFRHADVHEAKILSQVMMMMEDKEELGDNLYGMLFDAQIPDQNKNYILKVMDFLGYRPEVMSYGEVFNNPEKAVSDARQSLITQVWFNPEIIPQVLDEMSELAPQTRDALLEDLYEYPASYILAFLKSIAYLDDTYMASHAVKVLGNSTNAQSKKILRELRSDIDRQFLHQMIDREITRMTLKGIEDAEDSDIYLLKGVKQLGEVYQGAVSQIDGQGNRIVIFARRLGNGGGLVVMNFLVNLSEGLRDCWGYQRMKVRNYKGLLKEFREEGHMLSMDTDYARQIFCDALYVTNIKENYRPPEFAYWRQLLTEEWLKEESYTPKLDENVVNEVLQEAVSPERKEIRELHERYDFQDWFLHHPYIYELMEDVIHTHKDNSSVAVPLTTQDSVENIYAELIEQLVAPNLDYYKRALLMAADFNLKRGRTRIYKNIIAAIITLGDGDIDQLKKHPFFIGLGKRSLKIAAVNMRSGMDLRVNPEDFDF